jgi:hypothetical protein
MAKTSTAKKETGNFPLFFKNPVPLMADKHAEAGLLPEASYEFSKGTNSVPISHNEFIEAAKFYPIVFSSTAEVDPVVVLGVENDKNLFVTADGKWAKDKYVPAYVRRYPFVFTSDGKEKLFLCVDEASERFVKKAKKKDINFFAEGKQTDATNNALEFCKRFYNDQLATHAFAKKIADAGLLADKKLTVTPKDGGKPINLTGFKIVDAEKLQKLDDKTVVEWHKNGLLSLIYLHLVSLSNFNNISKLIK